MLKIPVYFRSAWETSHNFIAKVYKNFSYVFGSGYNLILFTRKTSRIVICFSGSGYCQHSDPSKLTLFFEELTTVQPFFEFPRLP